MHCNRFIDSALNRRDMLLRSASGFGAMALLALLREPAFGGLVGETAGEAAGDPDGSRYNPLAPRPTHFAARARSVIFLFMDGGPSQVDTFDPKPRLDREHGQPIKVKTQPTQFNNVGNVLRCPWKFRSYGESGLPVSDLFPHLGRCADDLAVDPIDGLELLGAHDRQLLHPHRQRPPGPAQPRCLGHLWTGERVSGLARLRRAQWRLDPARGNGLLQQRVPAGGLPGVGVQGAGGSGRQYHPHRTDG